MYYVYVLQSQKDKSLYTGMTKNVQRRLLEHNSGKTKSITHKIPYRLVYVSSCFMTGTEARKFEKYLKSGAGREFINSLKF